MAEQNDEHFPDLSSKLAAPTKKSVFERQRAEAEAKRQREAAETAAVYDDFVKSFEDEDDIPVGPALGSKQKPSNVFDSAPRAPSGPSKRHFAPTGRNSGPGSLGPPPNLSKKRTFEGSRREERARGSGLFAFEDSSDSRTTKNAFNAAEDDEEERIRESREAERAAAKPTLQLTSLPPGTSPAVIKSLVSPHLSVDSVRVVTPPAPHRSHPTDRKSMSAIVTLAQDTAATDIDTAVSSLQNRYLGWGFNLSLSRHLSSAALGSSHTSMPAMNSGLSSLPFNAQPVAQAPTGPLNRAPPPDSHRGGFAPPSSYASNAYNRGPPPVQVQVKPPSDIKQLKLIHKTVENLITHGPEFEALLMTRPQVQKEERWAWIWNPRSSGGVYYRWRLWEMLSGSAARQRNGHRLPPARRLFEGAALWSEPEEALPFEFTTKFEELISDADYNSSDEEDSGDEGNNRKRRRGMDSGRASEGLLNRDSEEQTYLNPLQRAKLTHLLARLPDSTARLRKGDVARITAFAISHAGQGAEEVVNMLVHNIMRPFCWSRHANPDRINEKSNEAEMSSDGPIDDSAAVKDDSSPAMLIALHLISDILSASSTSGVRHAWRYRALFEASLTSRKIFAFLGRLEKTLKWGRLRAEKWKRSVNNILQLWEGWCVFPGAAQEKFVEDFNKPPLTKEEEETEAREQKERERSKHAQGAKSRWKAVDINEKAAEAPSIPADVDGDPMDEDADVDGAPMGDIDGMPMDDLDGAPMEDVDGEAMPEDDDGGVIDQRAESEHGTAQQREAEKAEKAEHDRIVAETAAAKARRSRPKAEDMFANESDDE